MTQKTPVHLNRRFLCVMFGKILIGRPKANHQPCLGRNKLFDIGNWEFSITAFIKANTIAKFLIRNNRLIGINNRRHHRHSDNIIFRTLSQQTLYFQPNTQRHHRAA